MGLTNRLNNGNGVPELPMCGGQNIRRSSDGLMAKKPQALSHRTMSVSTSHPSIYEYNTPRTVTPNMWTPPPSPQVSHVSQRVSSVGSFLGDVTGRHESNPYKKRGSKNYHYSTLHILITAALFLLPWAGHQMMHLRFRRQSSALDDLSAGHKRIIKEIERKTDKARKLETDLKDLKIENHRLLADLHARGDVFQPQDSSYREMELVEESLLQRIDSLQQGIQQRSKREALAKFGKGPHRVEVTLRGGQKDTLPAGSKFIIELAPIDIMPHAVNHFLKMVAKKLWDGLSFVHRDLHSHVLQATPLDIQNAERVDSRFYSANLGKLSFSEYSPEFPHKPYTVGFAGRPGGPDFYVNTIDNSVSHGPQDENHEVDEGESCFGIVTSGRDVLDSLLIDASGAAKIKLVEIESIRMI